MKSVASMPRLEFAAFVAAEFRRRNIDGSFRRFLCFHLQPWEICFHGS